MDQILKLRIISPKETIYEGQVYSVSSTNFAGRFDILPAHANFITLIENQQISIKNLSGETQTFKFPLAIVYSQKDQVNIYTNIKKLI